MARDVGGAERNRLGTIIRCLCGMTAFFSVILKHLTICKTAVARMGETEVNARGGKIYGAVFEHSRYTLRSNDVELTEVFHLD